MQASSSSWKTKSPHQLAMKTNGDKGVSRFGRTQTLHRPLRRYIPTSPKPLRTPPTTTIIELLDPEVRELVEKADADCSCGFWVNMVDSEHEKRLHQQCSHSRLFLELPGSKDAPPQTVWSKFETGYVQRVWDPELDSEEHHVSPWLPLIHAAISGSGRIEDMVGGRETSSLQRVTSFKVGNECMNASLGGWNGEQRLQGNAVNEHRKLEINVEIDRPERFSSPTVADAIEYKGRIWRPRNDDSGQRANITIYAVMSNSFCTVMAAKQPGAEHDRHAWNLAEPPQGLTTCELGLFFLKFYRKQRFIHNPIYLAPLIELMGIFDSQRLTILPPNSFSFEAAQPETYPSPKTYSARRKSIRMRAAVDEGLFCFSCRCMFLGRNLSPRVVFFYLATSIYLGFTLQPQSSVIGAEMVDCWLVRELESEISQPGFRIALAIHIVREILRLWHFWTAACLFHFSGRAADPSRLANIHISSLLRQMQLRGAQVQHHVWSHL
ncbi:hypothetical protein C8J56DRAFT_1065470 [Mycena floridula]|nr:hypothetical protein C8J56DRAFT_1065470 [Mycena floridula]